MKEDKLIEIFSGSSIEAGSVASLLEESGIQVMIHDEYIGILAPWYVSPGGGSPVKIMISSKDYENAKLLIDEFKKK